MQPCLTLVSRSGIHFSPDWNISSATGWIALQSCTDIHGLQRMTPTDFGDPIAVLLAPPHLSSEICQHLLNDLADIHGSLRMYHNDFWLSSNFSSAATLRLTFRGLSEIEWHWFASLLRFSPPFFVRSVESCIKLPQKHISLLTRKLLPNNSICRPALNRRGCITFSFIYIA